MAHIQVQPKRKSYWWLWLLLLIVIAGVVYYLYQNNMLPAGKASIGKPGTSEPSAIRDTTTDTATSDSGLHSKGGTGQ